MIQMVQFHYGNQSVGTNFTPWNANKRMKITFPHVMNAYDVGREGILAVALY